MKRIVVMLLMCVGMYPAFAQEVYTSSGKPGFHKKTKKQKGYDASRLVLGSSVAINFGGGYADVGLAPIVGYRFTKNLFVGVGLGYEYVQQVDQLSYYSTSNSVYFDRCNIVYPNVWARYFVWRGVYLAASFEYDIMWRSYPVINVITNEQFTAHDQVSVPSLLMGAGIRQPIDGRVSLFLELNWDFLQDVNSPYNTPYAQAFIPRAGVTIGL